MKRNYLIEVVGQDSAVKACVMLRGAGFVVNPIPHHVGFVEAPCGCLAILMTNERLVIRPCSEDQIIKPILKPIKDGWSDSVPLDAMKASVLISDLSDLVRAGHKFNQLKSILNDPL